MSLVSIIIPVYNAENFIDETIKSVINQSYSNWELILIDDYSKDRSFEIASKYRDDKRIKLIKNSKNLGVIVSRNIGIKIAQGKYIAFLDADDLWKPLKLEMQINFMMSQDLSISFTEYEKINEDGTIRGVLKMPNKIDYKLLLKSNFMGCLTVIYDQEKLGKKFFIEVDKSEDYVLWLEIIKEVKEIKCLNYNLASYRVLKQSRSSNKLSAIRYQWIIYREHEKLNVYKSLYCFIIHLFYGYKRFKV